MSPLHGGFNRSMQQVDRIFHLVCEYRGSLNSPLSLGALVRYGRPSNDARQLKSTATHPRKKREHDRIGIPIKIFRPGYAQASAVAAKKRSFDTFGNIRSQTQP
jgi:hypothetical protein